MLNHTPARIALNFRRTNLAILAVVVGAFVSSCAEGNPVREPDGDGDRTDYFSRSALVAASETIIVGRVVGERDETFEFRSASSGAVVANLTERVMTVEVSTVVKGSVQAGEQVAVLQTVSSARSGREGAQEMTFDPIGFSKDSEYVFFLVPAALPPDFEGPEKSVWARPGEPGFARVTDGELEFVASQRYRAQAETLGYPTLENAEEFRISLDKLIESAGE